MLKIKIDTKNSAFNGIFKRFEIKRCLKEVIRNINGCNDEGNLYDTNGYKCGTFKLTNR